jgi:uncharacterized protein YjiS (DUF1127 family)
MLPSSSFQALHARRVPLALRLLREELEERLADLGVAALEVEAEARQKRRRGYVASGA